MYLCKIFSLIAASVFVVSCARISVAPLPSPNLHQVPYRSYCMAIDDQAGMAILGNREIPQLVFFDLKSGNSRSVDVPIVPRVALTLGEFEGLAVFGHETSKLRSETGIPTSKFLIVRNGSFTEHQLAEPIRARHGMVWRDRRQFILGDHESDTLVFIDKDRILKTVAAKPNAAIPIARFVLEDEPYDFQLVSTSHLAVSYAHLGFVDIIDLDSVEVTDRLESPGYSESLQLASLLLGFNRNFFMILDMRRTTIELLTLAATKGRSSAAETIEYIPIERAIWPIRAQKRLDGQILAFQASNDSETVWLGYDNLLLVYKLDA